MHYQELGDYIGAESCLDFRPEVAAIVSNGGAGMNPPRLRRRSGDAEKEYPPAIPSLVRTENPPSHTPRVMRKYSTSDGRLVIKEEHVKRRQYFHAHRSNGRLLLNLVPLDAAVEESFEEHRAGDEGEEKFDFPDNVAVSGEEINGVDERINDRTAEELHSEGNKLYNGIGINPCVGFVVALVEFPPPVLT